MTSKNDTPRVGSTMLRVLYYVDRNPGTSQQMAAISAGPNGSHAYGSRSVQRCLRARLIADTKARKNGYSLVITDAGRTALANS